MANYRNEKLRRAIATLPCQICGKHGTQASRSNQLRDGKKMWDEAHRRTMGALFENGLIGVL